MIHPEHLWGGFDKQQIVSRYSPLLKQVCEDALGAIENHLAEAHATGWDKMVFKGSVIGLTLPNQSLCVWYNKFSFQPTVRKLNNSNSSLFRSDHNSALSKFRCCTPKAKSVAP